MKGLNLHAGGELVPYEQLLRVVTPEATATHVPVPHHQLVQLVRGTLAMFGHEIVEEHHALDKDGLRYFGLMTLKSTYSDYTDTVGLRNSADKSFPVGIAFGSCTFVCSNLAFIGDHVIKRRHTANAKRELPGLLMEIVEPLALQREAQHRKFLEYRETPLDDAAADHIIMSCYRDGIINLTRIADVEKQWREPEYDWGPPTAYRMFNAVTYALDGRVMENNGATPRLHALIDGVCHELTPS